MTQLDHYKLITNQQNFNLDVSNAFMKRNKMAIKLKGLVANFNDSQAQDKWKDFGFNLEK